VQVEHAIQPFEVTVVEKNAAKLSSLLTINEKTNHHQSEIFCLTSCLEGLIDANGNLLPKNKLES